MVALVDLGLRLESLLHATGYAMGLGESAEPSHLADIEIGVAELTQVVELVEIIVTGELPFMDDDELGQFPAVENEPSNGKD